MLLILDNDFLFANALVRVRSQTLVLLISCIIDAGYNDHLSSSGVFFKYWLLWAFISFAVFGGLGW